MRTTVKTNGKELIVDTAKLYDGMYETMIFAVVDNEIDCGNELWCERCASKDDAYIQHMACVVRARYM